MMIDEALYEDVVGRVAHETPPIVVSETVADILRDAGLPREQVLELEERIMTQWGKAERQAYEHGLRDGARLAAWLLWRGE